MCLFKKSKIPRIALKNIVVYKILRAYKLDGKKYYETFIRNFQVNLDCIYTGKFDRYESLYKSFKEPWINSGYIHSFNSLEKAKKILNSPDACIVECIIPIGTLYWKGDNNEIASRKLKYNKVIIPEAKCLNYVNLNGTRKVII